MKEGDYNHFSLFPCITVRANFTEFLCILTDFCNIVIKCRRYTIKVSGEVFVDKNSDLDPDVAGPLSYSSEQVCKTGRQDGVETTGSFQTLFDAETTVVTFQISVLRLSPTAGR